MEVIHGTNDLKSTQTTIPFFKSNNLDYADLVGFMGEHAQTAGWILFVIITIFVVTAVSNGANLNDGMDGMAAGNSAIIGATLGVLAYVSSHIEFASYLNIMYIPGSEELVIYICAFIGALIVSYGTMPIRHKYSWETQVVDHRWYYCRFCYYHPQRTADTDSLWRVPGREPVGHTATLLL